VGMLGASAYGFGMVSKSFFPPSTRPQFMVHYWLPQGTHVRRTEQDMMKIEQHLLKTYKGNPVAEGGADDYGDSIQDVSTFVGGGALRFLLTYTPEDANTGYGMFLVTVNNYTQIDGLMEEIQEYLDANYPNAQAFSRKFQLGPGEPQKIHLRFRGDDPEVLRALAAETVQVMRDEPLATDVLSDWRQQVPMIRPQVAEAPARNAGLTRAQIANSFQASFEGMNVGVYREGDLLLPIIFRAPDEERLGVTNIENVQVYSPVAGRAIPIQQVVHGFDVLPEDTLMHRRNRRSTITVKCDPAVGTAEPVRQKIAATIAKNEFIQDKLADPKLRIEMEWGGEYEDSGDAQAGLASKMPVVFLLMILTVIVLFNSIRKPLIIFLTVPLALIGVTAGLLLTSQPFGFMALLGFMSLSGMLIKNAIVLIDEINAQLAEGKDPYDAIVMSGVSRLRPVAMAALTTVLGMIPLLADAFFVAMAVTIMFGLAFATVLTLVIIPVLFAVFFNVPSPKTA
jgi:multidrug efflux pump subunit AcrB